MEIEILEKKCNFNYIKNILESAKLQSNNYDKEKILLIKEKYDIVKQSIDDSLSESSLESFTKENKTMHRFTNVNHNKVESSPTIIFKSSESDTKKTDNLSEDSEDNSNPKDSTDSIYNDDYLYKKPWTKLANIHKIIKVKEYINKLLISKVEDKDKLKETLVKLINNKILTKKDMVKYDNINGRIISIPKLVFKNNKYYFDMT